MNTTIAICGRRRKNSPYPVGEAADRTQDFGNPRNEDGLWLSPCNYIRCRYDCLRTSYDATLSANQSQHYHCRLLASVPPRLEPVVWLAHLIASVRCDWLKQLFKFRFHERLIKSSATVTNVVQKDISFVPVLQISGNTHWRSTGRPAYSRQNPTRATFQSQHSFSSSGCRAPVFHWRVRNDLFNLSRTLKFMTQSQVLLTPFSSAWKMVST